MNDDFMWGYLVGVISGIIMLGCAVVLAWPKKENDEAED